MGKKLQIVWKIYRKSNEQLTVTHIFYSIIIPTYNSAKVFKYCLKGLKQNYPQDKYEVIVVDNYSSDKTREMALISGFKVLLQEGKAPQVCQQRNLGIKYVQGDYLIVLDHDMELPVNFLRHLSIEINKTNNKIDAWYIPEKVVAENAILSKIRTLEKRFYDGTVISAARIFKKEILKKSDGYDVSLSNGPADWDMDNQLRLTGAKFATLHEYLFHHEEKLSFWGHIFKKGSYIKGAEIYKMKWQKKDSTIYDNIIVKQFSPIYRYIIVFVENHKCYRYLLPNLGLFIILFISKILMGLVYLVRKNK